MSKEMCFFNDIILEREYYIEERVIFTYIYVYNNAISKQSSSYIMHIYPEITYEFEGVDIICEAVHILKNVFLIISLLEIFTLIVK